MKCLLLLVSLSCAILQWEGRVLAAPSESAQSHYQAGLAAKQAKNYDKAAVELKKAVELDPDYLDAHWVLAWVYVAQEMKEPAAEQFREVIRLGPDSDKAKEAAKALERMGAGAGSTVAGAAGSPDRGRYLGAFIEEDPTVKGNIDEFERLVGRPLAFYSTYAHYRRPFPAFWAANVESHGRGLLVFMEGVLDDLAAGPLQVGPEIEQWARTASRAHVPVLVCVGAEFNLLTGNQQVGPQAFLDGYRRIAAVFREKAPAVELVWAVAGGQRPLTMADLRPYYPGDDLVDWVGITLFHHRNQPTDLAQLLQPLQSAFKGKPIAIVELGCDQGDTESPAKLTTLLQDLPVRFPRIRLVNYFSLDASRRVVRPKELNYALIGGSPVLDAFSSLVAAPGFLGGVPSPTRLVSSAPREAQNWATRGDAFLAVTQALAGPGEGAAQTPTLSMSEATRRVAEEGLVNGYPDGSFRPERFISDAELALVLTRLHGRGIRLQVAGQPPEPFPPAPPPAELLARIPPDHWAYQCFHELANLGVVPWESTRQPEVNALVTAAELRSALWKLAAKISPAPGE
jgi:tetratricopeptide (TPR) repeat protein